LLQVKLAKVSKLKLVTTFLVPFVHWFKELKPKWWKVLKKRNYEGTYFLINMRAAYFFNIYNCFWQLWNLSLSIFGTKPASAILSFC